MEGQRFACDYVFPVYYVFPVTTCSHATYGCETWSLHKSQIKKIRSFEQWCWRRLLRIPWTAKRTNESVQSEIGTDMTLDRVILKQKLTFFGHIIRAQGLEAEVMLGMGNGARSRGRPRRRWIDEIVDVTGIALSKLTRVGKE